MFFLVFYVAALATGALRLRRAPRSRRRPVAVLLQHLLVVGYGLGGVFAFIGHRFRADDVAESIGWPTGSPFQQEIAFANLGSGVTGLLCAREDRSFWNAVAVSSSLFYLGAAAVHIRELREGENRSLNNAGAILPDILTPATTLALAALNQRRR